MKCSACGGGLPPGKIIFCPTCFFSLPRRDQGALLGHYVRVAKAAGRPVDAEHPGIRDKVAKLARAIRAARGLTEPPKPAPVLGVAILDAPVRTDAMLQFNEGRTK